MRIFRYFQKDHESYGVLNDNYLVDIPKLSGLVGEALPSNLSEYVTRVQKPEVTLDDLLKHSSAKQREASIINKREIVMKVPIATPSKIICIGLNYRDHVEESGMKLPDEPIFFMKPKTSLLDPDQPVIRPNMVKKLDYEVELAIIIGKKGKKIQVSEANQHIFGYTILNDISARDIQFKDGQWTRGKSFDTFAPMGPCVSTRAQIINPENLSLSTKVNGKIRQKSSTSKMVFNVYELVYHISRVMTLEPLDIIATGTPGGVASFMKPKPKFLEPGDVVEVELEKIGFLRNPIFQEPF